MTIDDGAAADEVAPAVGAAPGRGTVQVEALARVLGVTPRRVQQLAKEGVFPRAVRGWYPLVPCIQAYIKFWQDRATAPEREDVRKSAFLDAKTRAMRATADRQEAENLETRRKLLPVEVHFDVVATLLRTVGEELRAAPQRWRVALEGRSGVALTDALRDLAEKAIDEVRAAVLAVPLYGPGEHGAPLEPDPAPAPLEDLGASSPDEPADS